MTSGATRPARQRARESLSALLVAAAAAGCGHAPPAGETEAQAPADPVQDVEAEQLFSTGLQLAGNGDLTRAEQYVAASITRGFPEEQALPVLLRICIAGARYRIALGYADPYLRDHPDDWSLRYLVASIHLGMGNAVAARQELERIVRMVPEEADPHYLLALVLRDEVGDPRSAERHLRRYLALAPEGRHASEVTHALERVRIDLPPQPDGDPEGEEAPAPAGGEEGEP